MTSPVSALGDGSGSGELGELAPVVRRAVALDPRIPVRLRRRSGRCSAVLRLPFGVLAGRTITVAAGDPAAERPLDVTVDGGDLLAWLDGERPAAPQPRDERWRGSLPPDAGWRRVETIPADVIREVVANGRRSSAGLDRRRADALLDAAAIRVSDEHGASLELPLRTVTALTRLGFAPAGSQVAVDRCGRWIRLAGLYGSVYVERPGAALTLAG